ncbi:sialin isoform X2 [Phymastichus coffea]|uniref:sialin isoform X2 n=1 Tax=Phymastichus coffea TaxID=108790 RepID=UPI00273AC50E|nr:sialin isoform X2 [Phymastichus coffea]
MATAAADEVRGFRMIPMRYLMSIMGSIGMAIIYGFKVNLSIAIVAMVNHTAVAMQANTTARVQHNVTLFPNGTTMATMMTSSMEKECNATLERNYDQDGPFVWTKDIEGFILSSYFIGYIVSLIPGGMMAEYVSAKWVLNISVLLNVLASMLMPTAAEIHYTAFIAMRIIQGIGGGVSFPAIHVMVSKWAPPNERSILASIAYAGTALGTVISILLSGMIAANLGWKWVFYIEGLLCLIWCTAWLILVQDSPEQQKIIITDEERQFILNSQGEPKETHKQKLSSVPWFQIMRSAPFWAILVAHFCNNFGWYMLLIELPIFMSKILHYDLKSNAWLSALPYFCMWIFTLGLSKLLVIMQDKNWISVTVSRKIGTLFSSAVPMFCLLGVSYASDKNTVVALMTIAITCIGGMYCGFLANHIDIAPNYAGTLVALTNTVATIPGFVVPIFVGYFVKECATTESWRVIFFLMVGLYIIEMLIYTMFGTGEEQPWNKLNSHNIHNTEQTVPLKETRHPIK